MKPQIQKIRCQQTCWNLTIPSKKRWSKNWLWAEPLLICKNVLGHTTLEVVQIGYLPTDGVNSYVRLLKSQLESWTNSPTVEITIQYIVCNAQFCATQQAQATLIVKTCIMCKPPIFTSDTAQPSRYCSTWFLVEDKVVVNMWDKWYIHQHHPM